MKDIVTFEPPGTIVLTFKGALTPEKAEKMVEKWADIKPYDEEVKILVDQAELTDIPPKAREILRKFGSKLRVSKLSVFGATTKMRIMGGLIIKMVPQVKKSKFFETEEEARTWLNENNEEK